jgi:sterol desaturase/sphingolipid hydroxylase (fatty acid hydroxylase superfamily)
MSLFHRNPWILAAALALALAEYVWRRASGRGYDLGQAATSLGVALVRSALRPASLVATTFVLGWAGRFAPWRLPTDEPLVWVLGFLAAEFAYYWFHRLSHRVAWMWATHAVHHSATQMVLPAAIRLGWTELVSGGWIAFVPLALLGFAPEMIGLLLGLNLLYQYLLHTEAPISFGPLEWVLNTPRHHRVHHSCDAAFLDCNFGGVLILFDRLFGTFRAAPRNAQLRYGLAHPLGSNHLLAVGLGPWRQLFAALAAAKDWPSRLALALGPPV